MTRLGIIALLVACQQEPPTVATPTAAHDPCEDYRRAVEGARGQQGSVEIEVYNACGCPVTLQTRSGRAAEIRDALARVSSANLRCSVNCDQPCSPNDSRF